MYVKISRDTSKSKICLRVGISLFCLWLMFIITGCNSGDSIKTNDTTKKENIVSSIIGDSYSLYISLPEDYDRSSDSYSVVYLLDGDTYFSAVKQMIYTHVRYHDMNPVILVGIGNSEKRERDYTPTACSDGPSGGGSKNFCDFLKTEIIPYIDSQYRTISNPENRCLVGHSLGGLCSYYALFYYNDVFHKFIAASSSLQWDGGIFFKYEQDYASTHASLPVTLYTTVCTGDYAVNVYQNEMLKRLKDRGYSGLVIYSDTLEGEVHVNSWRSAFDKGLPKLL